MTKTHLMTDTPEFTAWKNMKRRCMDKNIQAYKNYGGRGIKVTGRWIGRSGFANFFEDMGLRPSTKHSLDRIDNNKGYYKENCRWTTRRVQNINQRIKSNSTTGITGVNFHKPSGKWRAVIGVDGHKIALGAYTNIQDAVDARKLAEEKYFKPILDKAIKG